MPANRPLRKAWKLLSGAEETQSRAGCQRLLYALQAQQWWPHLQIRTHVFHDDDELCMWLTNAAWMRLAFVSWTVRAGSPEQYNLPLDDLEDEWIRDYLSHVNDPDGVYSVLVPPQRMYPETAL